MPINKLPAKLFAETLMEQYLQPLMDYLRQHPQLGILFTFLTALIESLPILGTLFPGAITMTAIGALIGSSVLPPLLTCISAILGALLGDCLGFWLGNRYHEKIRLIWLMRKFSKYIDYSERFFIKHGGKSIIIGRFIGPTRAAMPMIAGILRLSWAKFLPPAIFAAIAWALIYMTPGILLGALAMDLSEGDMTKVFLSGLAVIVGLWLAFWLLQYFFKQVSRAINHQLQITWKWLNHSKASYFVRLIRNQRHPYDFRQLRLALLFLLCGLLFLLVWINVYSHGFITRPNLPLFYLTESFRSPNVDRFWILFTTVATPETLLIIGILISAGLWFSRQRRAGTHLALLSLVTAAGVEAVKKFYYSPRPTGLVSLDLGSSFPSGHAAMSVAVLGFLAFLTARCLPRVWRPAVAALFIILILLCGVSRIFLGQHWFSDVLGSWFFALSLLLLTILSYRRQPRGNSWLRMPAQQWLSILLACTLLPWLITGLLTYRKVYRDTQPLWPTSTLDFQAWWQEPLRYAPIYRLDRFGEAVQPFNVQWSGRLDQIEAFLLSRNWERLQKLSRIQTALQRFTSPEPESNLPLLAMLHRNQPPALFLIKHIPNSPDILELRLWESGIKFAYSPRSLWLGILTYHTPPEKLLRFPRRYTHLQSGNILVIDKLSIPGDLEFQLARVPANLQPKRIRALHWDGEIFILGI